VSVACLASEGLRRKSSEVSCDVSYEVLAHQVDDDDAAALIHSLDHLAETEPDSDAMNRIIKIARAYPGNLEVILQVALALQVGSPTNAMKSLQSVIEQNHLLNTPIMAFCNVCVMCRCPTTSSKSWGLHFLANTR
jgi:hypothetical protein